MQGLSIHVLYFNLLGCHFTAGLVYEMSFLFGHVPETAATKNDGMKRPLIVVVRNHLHICVNYRIKLITNAYYSCKSANHMSLVLNKTCDFYLIYNIYRSRWIIQDNFEDIRTYLYNTFILVVKDKTKL
jgi:hypothetical protein